MERYQKYISYTEMELSINLSQIEACLTFLHYMYFDEEGVPDEKPRNETERQSIINNLERIKESRQLLKNIIVENQVALSEKSHDNQ